jgi:hypothetical protein
MLESVSAKTYTTQQRARDMSMTGALEQKGCGSHVEGRDLVFFCYSVYLILASRFSILPSWFWYSPSRFSIFDSRKASSPPASREIVRRLHWHCIVLLSQVRSGIELQFDKALESHDLVKCAEEVRGSGGYLPRERI